MTSGHAGQFLETRTGALSAVIVVTVAGFLMATIRPPMLGGALTIVVTVALMALVAWLKGTGLGEYGLQRPASWPATLVWGVVWFLVALLVFRLLLEPLLEQWTGAARDLSRFDYVEGDSVALMILLLQLWIMAAIFEELYFRGFLINGLADVFGRVPLGWAAAVTLSCLLFASLHGYQGPAGLGVTLAGAVFLSLIYLWHGRNLWIPIIVHGLHDSSAVIFKYLGIYDRVVHLVL